MNDEDRALIAAYALDAVDDLERRTVERLVAHDPAAARELGSLQATAALLGAAMVDPAPQAVRTSVLGALGSTSQEAARSSEAPVPATAGDRGRGKASDPSITRERSRTRRGPSWLAAAAAVAVAIALPGSLAWQEHRSAVQARVEAQLVSDVLADPGVRVVGGEVTGGGRAFALLSDSRGLLVVSGLPEVPAGSTYQLWAMRDGVPMPAGLLASRGGDTEILAADYRAGDGLALSVEPAGGSGRPTTTPVLVLIPG